MSVQTAKAVIDLAFADAVEAAEDLSEVYQQKLDDFRVHSIAVLNELEAGVISPEDALHAAEQEFNAVKSTLLSGAYDARRIAAEKALSFTIAVVKAVLVAAV
jgi:hypothetical protein